MLEADALVVVVATEVVALRGVAEEFVVEVAELLLQSEEAYVVGAVHFGSAALFYLLQVAMVGVGVALADGEGAIGKVHEHFAAVEVVLGNGVGGVAFWGVGEYQYAEVMAAFEGLEVPDEGERFVGVCAGAGAEAADVIDNEHLRGGALYGAFDGAVDVLLEGFEFGRHLGVGIELGPVEVWGEIVAGVMVAVTAAELGGGEFEVDIEHGWCVGAIGGWVDGCAAGQLVPELYGEDGFADVGIGEEDAKLVAVPEVAEEFIGFGRGVVDVEPVVAGVDGEEVFGGLWLGDWVVLVAFSSLFGLVLGVVAEELEAVRAEHFFGLLVQWFISSLVGVAG